MVPIEIRLNALMVPVGTRFNTGKSEVSISMTNFDRKYISLTILTFYMVVNSHNNAICMLTIFVKLVWEIWWKDYYSVKEHNISSTSLFTEGYQINLLWCHIFDQIPTYFDCFVIGKPFKHILFNLAGIPAFIPLHKKAPNRYIHIWVCVNLWLLNI